MKKFRMIVAVIALILMLVTLTLINYDDLSWSANTSNYLGLMAGVTIIGTAFYSNNYEKKQGNDTKK